MKLLAVALILPATIVLVIAAFETQILYPPASNAPTKGLVWHGRTFASRGDFARWLRSRGVRYAVWARRHPSPQKQAARAKRTGQKGSDWSAENVGGGFAVLASLGLVVVLVRRRRPSWSGGLVRQTLPLTAHRAAPAARGGTRLMLRWAKATALLSSSAAKVSANVIRRRGTEFARFLARRGAPAAERGARLMLRWAKATALLSSSAAKSSARIIRRRGTEFARFLARGAAPAAKGGARLMLRWATATALLSSSLAASSANTIRRRRSEFAWYLATALLAAGIGIVATVWLNRV